MKTLFRFIGKLILLIVTPILVYLLVTVVLIHVPCNSDFAQSPNGLPIYLRSQGMHTEIGFALKDSDIDWKNYVDLNAFEKKAADIEVLWFGWGDRKFYLDVPSWDSLDYAITAKAAFLPTEAIMQITAAKQAPDTSRMCKKVMVSPFQFQQMEKFILADLFVKDEKASLIEHGDVYPHRDDRFFLANRKYSMLYNCNTWTNEVLIEGGVKTATWTPWDKGILRHFK